MKQATIEEALKYPFAKFKRLFYWLWLFIPILGWFAFGGYCLKIVENIINGKFKQVPKFGKFWDNFVLGIYVFVLGITVGIILMFISLLTTMGGIPGGFAYLGAIIYSVLVVPIMFIQLAETKDLAKAFNIVRAHKIVFNNFSKYIVVLLLQIVISIIWAIASIPLITIIITIPASSYTKYYLFARFYRDLKKKPKY